MKKSDLFQYCFAGFVGFTVELANTLISKIYGIGLLIFLVYAFLINEISINYERRNKK